MKIILTALMLIALAVCCSPEILSHQPVLVGATPVCEQSNRRTITLTAETQAGAPANNLRPEDLSITENGTSLEVLDLALKTNDPLAVAILIDTSVSQERTLSQTRTAALQFLETLLPTAKHRAAVISFTGQPTVEEQLTNDATKLRAALARVKVLLPTGYVRGGLVVGPIPRHRRVAGTTAIWDAVWTTTEMLKAERNARAVIILLTDGEDTSSDKSLRDAVEHAARYDASVFAIGIADKSYGGPNRSNLNKLSEETGGRAFFPKDNEALNAALRQIDQEIRGRYLLTYCGPGSNTAKRLPKVKITLKGPQAKSDLRLLYRHYGL